MGSGGLPLSSHSVKRLAFNRSTGARRVHRAFPAAAPAAVLPPRLLRSQADPAHPPPGASEAAALPDGHGRQLERAGDEGAGLPRQPFHAETARSG